GSVLSQKGFGYDFLMNQNDLNRVMVWDQAKDAIQTRPMLGYGLENFKYAFQDTFNPALFELRGDSAWFDKVHNTTLQVFVETGFIGSFAFLLLFLSIMWSSIKSYAENRKFAYIIPPLILLIHLIQTQTAFDTNSSMLLVFVLIAYIINTTDIKPKDIKINSEPKKYIFIAVGVVFVVLSLSVTYVSFSENKRLVAIASVGKFE